MCLLTVIANFILGGCNFRSKAPQSADNPRQLPVQSAVSRLPLTVGDLAPDFSLRDLNGRQVSLSEYRAHMPVVVEFGSLTCPIVTGHVGRLDTLAQQHQGKAQFWFVYANEEHPGQGEMRSTTYGAFRAIPQVKDYLDRCEHARLFLNTVKTGRRLLVDEDGAANVAAKYGIRGHGIVIVNTSGRIGWLGDMPTKLTDLDNALYGPTAIGNVSRNEQGVVNANGGQAPENGRGHYPPGYTEPELGRRGYELGTGVQHRR